MNLWKFYAPLIIIGLCTACTNTDSTQNDNSEHPNTTPTTKEVREIRYTDGGALVPNAMVRDVSIIVKDSTNAQLFYKTYVENIVSDTTQGAAKIPSNQLDLLYENMAKLADIPDGIEIMPGKVPCVGKKGIDVAVIFNTGDTSRFKINGAALCDRDVIPEWKLIDSLTNIIYSESIAKH